MGLIFATPVIVLITMLINDMATKRMMKMAMNAPAGKGPEEAMIRAVNAEKNAMNETCLPVSKPLFLLISSLFNIF
mgnify:CR=1 FL=1